MPFVVGLLIYTYIIAAGKTSLIKSIFCALRFVRFRFTPQSSRIMFLRFNEPPKVDQEKFVIKIQIIGVSGGLDISFSRRIVIFYKIIKYKNGTFVLNGYWASPKRLAKEKLLNFLNIFFFSKTP